MELDFVAWLKERLPANSDLLLGIGDDAAVLDWKSSSMVVTTDVLVDGVHFLSDQHDPLRIGHKSLAVNLSDLAAMGANPTGAVLGLVLPRNGIKGYSASELAVRLVEGMLPLAEQFGCPIVGGDTNLSDGPLTIAITAFGQPTPHGLLRRDAAKPGDQIYVTGPLGGSLAGKHLDFTPRIDEALALVTTQKVHAAMDITDGLAIDLARMCEASQVGAVLDQTAIPITEAAQQSGRQAWQHALNDGEDFELLLAIAPKDAAQLLTEPRWSESLIQVGVITDASADKTSNTKQPLQLRDPSGNLTPLAPQGYEHR